MSKNPPLTVLHIASGDLWAGAEVQLYTLARTLHANPNVRVHLVLLNHGRLEQECLNAGINVTIFDESELNGLQILRLLIHLIREQRPDVVHTHRLKENILGSIAAATSRKTVSVRTGHGAPEHRLPWWHFPKRMIFLLDRLCGRHLQCKIVAVSDDLASILAADFPSKQICVIENGVDLEAILKDHSSSTFQEDNRGTFKIGLAGRLVPVKRVDIIIQTALYLMNSHPDMKVSFHVFGDGPMRDELEKLSEKSGTDKLVSFEGHCDDMLKELQQLDVLLMTSDHEGLPMILLEAMALQTPIIAHAVGGIPKLLDDGSCGVLVYKQDGASYAKEVYKLYTSPETRSKIAKSALQHVIQNNSALQNANSYYDVYTEITNK